MGRGRSSKLARVRGGGGDFKALFGGIKGGQNVQVGQCKKRRSRDL